MVEPGRSAGARETKKTTSTFMKKKLVTTKPDKEKEKSSREKESSKKQSSHCTEPESPSYRLALKSLFSCRNSHGHSHARQHAPDSKKCKKIGCSASVCKLKDNPRVMQRPDQDATAAAAPPGEACKRRASVSACNSSSERCLKKPLSEVNAVTAAASKHGGSLSSTSSSSTGGSFRGMQLRRLSGCYECHMVVDPISGVFRDNSMRATICTCPDCGEIFVRAESLELHQSIRHAVSELGPEDTSRNIIEIIFQSSWLKKQSPVCNIDRILKVHNTPKTLARFEEYRDAVKAKAGNHQLAKKHRRRQRAAPLPLRHTRLFPRPPRRHAPLRPRLRRVQRVRHHPGRLQDCGLWRRRGGRHPDDGHERAGARRRGGRRRAQGDAGVPGHRGAGEAAAGGGGGGGVRLGGGVGGGVLQPGRARRLQPQGYTALLRCRLQGLTLAQSIH